MRDQFEEIKNACPWIKIHRSGKVECMAVAQSSFVDGECYYKNCAVLFWIRNLKCNCETIK